MSVHDVDRNNANWTFSEEILGSLGRLILPPESEKIMLVAKNASFSIMRSGGRTAVSTISNLLDA